MLTTRFPYCFFTMVLLSVTILCRAGGPPPIPILEGPANPEPSLAKNGFVHVRDGHLHLNGKRVRFWGVNCVSEPNRPKPEQVQLLDRIQALGFNAIRMHMSDFCLIDPEGSSYRVRTYTKGDDSRMDRMDHFIAAAMERGLHVWMTLDRYGRAIGPAAYDLLPPGDDETTWKQAIHSLTEGGKHGRKIERFWALDKRLEKAFTAYALDVFTHHNPYRGKTYAQEPGIALWELGNEGAFIAHALNGSIRKEHPYWQEQARKLWNGFLQKHYKNQEALLSAWGSLKEGESLANATVKLEPMPVFPGGHVPYHEIARYPSRRVQDLVTFFVNRYIEANSRLVQTLRKTAPEGVGASVVPIAFDTNGNLNLLSLYCATRGSFASVAGYKWTRTYDTSDPTYPFRSLLASPPSMHALNVGTLRNKPVVTYEANMHRPAPYRAEYPLMVASFISAQDWDGFFWYHWLKSNHTPTSSPDDLERKKLGYANLGDRHAGLEIAFDSLFVTSMRLAGQAFLSGGIAPATKPVLFTLGRRELLDSPVTHWTTFWYSLLTRAAFGPGMRLDFAPGQTAGQTRGEVPVFWPAQEISNGPHVKYVYGKRHMIVDSPTVHAFAGWSDSRRIVFSTGITLELSDPQRFSTFIMISRDGRPLETSRHIEATVLGTAENTGFVFDPARSKSLGWLGARQAVANVGKPPVIHERPAATLVWPAPRAGQATVYDAFPSKIKTYVFQKHLTFEANQPIGWIDLVFTK